MRTAAGDTMRRLPAGAWLLEQRRRAVRATTAWLRPPRPDATDERNPHFAAVQEDERLVTGNGFAERCRYVLNFGALRVNEESENEWWFVKTDFLRHFFRQIAPRDPIVLLTHNSDLPVDDRFRRVLDSPRIRAWFAVNPAFEHPKLFALPLGVANPYWNHGDAGAFRAVWADPPAKERLFDVSFAMHTNVEERTRCVAAVGIEPEPRQDFPRYLRRLAATYFCVSPRGNGIDTHRTWESLYVGTIPIVTRSVLTDQHPDLPLIVLDDWSDFDSIDFSPELYERTWGEWTRDELTLDACVARIEKALKRLS